MTIEVTNWTSQSHMITFLKVERLEFSALIIWIFLSWRLVNSRKPRLALKPALFFLFTSILILIILSLALVLHIHAVIVLIQAPVTVSTRFTVACTVHCFIPSEFEALVRLVVWRI